MNLSLGNLYLSYTNSFYAEHLRYATLNLVFDDIKETCVGNKD